MRLSSAAAHRPVRLHRPLAGPKTQRAANMAGKGSKEAAEADGVDKGLTQRLIDNSSRVHKRSNSLLLTKVRAQGRRPSRRPACLVSVHQSEVGKHMAAAIGPQTASTVPPPAAARRRRSGTCLACSRFCAVYRTRERRHVPPSILCRWPPCSPTASCTAKPSDASTSCSLSWRRRCAKPWMQTSVSVAFRCCALLNCRGVSSA